MVTVTLQIGNSDDKLTQQEWSNFIKDIETALKVYHANTHFSGGPSADKPWQNYCWVFEVESDELVITALKNQIVRIRSSYCQCSVAWLEGKCLFI